MDASGHAPCHFDPVACTATGGFLRVVVMIRTLTLTSTVALIKKGRGRRGLVSFEGVSILR